MKYKAAVFKNKANNFYNTYINNTNINKLSINKYISIVKKFKVDDISSLVEQALADEVDFEGAVDELKLLN